MKLKKILLGSLVLLLPLIATAQQKYDAELIAAEPFIDAIERTGKLDFKRTLSLSFKSTGYLTKLSVDEGDTFSAKQLLASMDTAELVQKKNASYAKLLQAKREVGRIKKLIASNLSAEKQLDDAKTAVETTRAAYQVDFYNLEKAQIIAPFDGVVLARNAELGELQSPGVEALKVAELKNNWVVKVALTGVEVGQVRVGQKVRVELDNLGQVEGIVNRIPAIANTDGHLFTIDILLPKMTLRSGVIAGQLAKVKIDFTSDNLVYRVPIAALVSVNPQGQAILMVDDNGEVSQQAFDIFKMNNDFVFLLANQQLDTLRIVTKGWQHITLGK